METTEIMKAYKAEQALTPDDKKDCPECYGSGMQGFFHDELTGVMFVLVKPRNLSCRCKGSGKLVDNAELLREIAEEVVGGESYNFSRIY